MIALVVGVLAQQTVQLESESTDLTACLDNEACGPAFLTLLSESLLEYGFVFQHDGLATSALGGKGTGVTFELHLDTVSLGAGNLITKEISLLPALPRLEVGYQVGSFTFDDPYPQYAVSAYFFPPVRFGDFTAFSVGGSASFSIPLGTHLVWAGAEVDVSYGSVSGPIVGDGGVINDIPLLAPFIDVGAPPCDGTERGCIDRYRQLAPAARLGVSFEPVDPVFFVVKVGAARVNSALDIAYDDARWVVRGIQPHVSYGGGFRFGDRLQLSAAGVTALKPARLSTDESRSITRLSLGFSVRTGDARYWQRDEPPEALPDEPDEPVAPDVAEP